MNAVLAILALLPFTFAAPCKDQSGDCKSMASTGYCTNDRYRKWMKVYCTESCGLCSDGGGEGIFPANCGQPTVPFGRVIAGETAKKGAWPWQIMMLYDGRKMCGGSLVAPNMVVTAAHCVYGRTTEPGRFSVRVGEHNDRVKEGTEDTIQVESINVRQDYNPRVLNNDLAVMKLSRPAKFGKYVSPVCVPEQDQVVPEGSDCYITGWGKIRHPGYMHHILQQGRLRVVSQKKCEALNTKNVQIRITDKMVCAGDAGRTRLSGCHGDSGGPFVCKVNGRWYLQGAVSWGSPTCDSSQTYTVFAKVAAFSDWLKLQA